jgi:NAD(P)-dependent dehydrogenase (short-subunit alcohol dehydrogenase family)
VSTPARRTVVITGAAGGIGRALVAQFSQLGGRIVAVDLEGARLDALRLQAPGVDVIAADITKPADCDRIIRDAGDRLDVLCNNAGILDRLQLIDEVDDELFRRVIEVNLTGTFQLSRRAVLKMKEQGGGVIINTASTSAQGGGRAGPAYASSKAGVIALTESIAVSCAEFGIRCNAILPGGTATQMAHTGGDPARALSERGLALLARLQGKPEPADPMQIARVAAFLASDDADRVSGVALRVDAGVFAY